MTLDELIRNHELAKANAARSKSAEERGVEVVIAGAGGAAHLPGMTASMTTIPVLGVPVQSKALNGMDSLLSIAQMPAGVAVAAQAIGSAGAYNAGLLAAQILATGDQGLAERLAQMRSRKFSEVSEEVNTCA